MIVFGGSATVGKALRMCLLTLLKVLVKVVL